MGLLIRNTMSRIRERYHELIPFGNPPGGYTYRELLNGFPYTGPNVVSWYDNRPTTYKEFDLEFMEDLSSDSAGKSGVNYVSHIRTKSHRLQIDEAHDYILNDGNGNRRDYFVAGPAVWWHSRGAPFTTYTHSDVLVTWPKTDEQLYREAESRFLDTNAVDNALSVLEAPELVPSATSLYRSGRNYFESRARFPRRAGRVGDLVAGGFLSYQFGVAPLISDMSKMQAQIGSLRDRMAMAKKMLEKPVRASAVTTGTIGFRDDNRPGIPMPYRAWTTGRSTMKIVSPPERRCVISGRYPVEYGSDLYKRFSYYLDKYGHSGPIHLIWERIPFSFVVDWFIDTSSILNHAENALRLDPKIVDRVSFSTKWGVSYSTQKLPYGGYVDDMDNKEVMTGSIASYHRIPGQYHISHTGLSSGRFGKKQVALASSLLYTIARSLAKRA